MPPKRRLGLRIFATARIAGYHVPDGFLKKYLLRRRLFAGSGRVDAVLYFVRYRRALASALPGLRQRISPKGCVWVFWPISEKQHHNLDAETVRHLAHRLEFIEGRGVTVCGSWKGIKLVFPK